MSKLSSKKKKIQLGILIFFILAISVFLILNYSKFKIGANLNTPVSKNSFSKRYVLWNGSITSQTQRDKLLTMMQQAAAAGYNGIVINDIDAVTQWDTDAKLNTDDRQIIENKAQELGLAVIPDYNLMYESSTNKTLAEAFPVKDTPFIAQNGVAAVQTTPQLILPNSGFENWSTADPNQPLNMFVDGPGTVAFRDNIIKHSGNSSIRFENTTNNSNFGMGRVFNYITVPKFRTYEVSVWLKTQNLNAPSSLIFNVSGTDSNGNNGRILRSSYSNSMGAGPQVAATQDWAQYKITFNSLDETKINIYFGASAATTGQYWFDDLNISEIGLSGTIRRDSLPLTVTSANDKQTYTEGKDYTVGDGKLIIPSNSAIKNSEDLKVSWYQYANTIDDTPLENMCHQEYWDQFKTDIAHLNTVYPNAYGFMIGIDEWRIANWDPACRNYNNGQDMTGGQYMAFAVQKMQTIYKQIKPTAQLYVWNDMFDPYHNAVPIYYAVNGTVQGSWEGLSADTEIMNWNSQQAIDPTTNKTKALSSLKFFANRGNSQIIAGYYDSANLEIDKFWLNLLNQNSDTINNIDGYMYTSWANKGHGNYSNLGAVADLIKANGRWNNNILINRPPDISQIPNTLTKKVNDTISAAEIEKATDLDNDSLKYTYSGWLNSLPYTVTSQDIGTHTLHLSVTDGKSDPVGKDINITVEANPPAVVNKPPDISNIPNSLTKDEYQTIESSEIEKATDPDSDSLKYTYSNWMTSLPYTLTSTDIGSHILHVAVTDGKSDPVGKDISVIVNAVTDTTNSADPFTAQDITPQDVNGNPVFGQEEIAQPNIPAYANQSSQNNASQNNNNNSNSSNQVQKGDQNATSTSTPAAQTESKSFLQTYWLYILIPSIIIIVILIILIIRKLRKRTNINNPYGPQF